MARRVEQRTRVQSLIRVPRPALGALARSQVAGKRSTACAHARCCWPCRRGRQTFQDPSRCHGLGQRGRWPCANPHGCVPCSLWTILSRRTDTLWSSMGEGGGRPTAVRHIYATGEPLILWAAIVVTLLTPFATLIAGLHRFLVLIEWQ